MVATSERQWSGWDSQRFPQDWNLFVAVSCREGGAGGWVHTQLGGSTQQPLSGWPVVTAGVVQTSNTQSQSHYSMKL